MRKLKIENFVMCQRLVSFTALLLDLPCWFVIAWALLPLASFCGYGLPCNKIATDSWFGLFVALSSLLCHHFLLESNTTYKAYFLVALLPNVKTDCYEQRHEVIVWWRSDWRVCIWQHSTANWLQGVKGKIDTWLSQYNNTTFPGSTMCRVNPP